MCMLCFDAEGDFIRSGLLRTFSIHPTVCQIAHFYNPFAARPKKYNTTENSGKQPIPQVTYTTVISIAYLASPDLSGTLGIIIYFLRRKYPACKAAKGLIFTKNDGLISFEHFTLVHCSFLTYTSTLRWNILLYVINMWRIPFQWHQRTHRKFRFDTVIIRHRKPPFYGTWCISPVQTKFNCHERWLWSVDTIFFFVCKCTHKQWTWGIILSKIAATLNWQQENYSDS